MIHQITPSPLTPRVVSPQIAHYYPLSKKNEYRKIFKNKHISGLKSPKSFNNMTWYDKKSESNHASLSSTLTTFWANNSFVFERYLIFFVKKSNNTYSIIRCDLRGNRLSGGGMINSWRKTSKSKIIIQT